MCTILTVSNTTVDIDSLVKHIESDGASNPHGFSLLMVTDNDKPMIIRSMDLAPIIDAVSFFKWKRIFLHTRYATQGGPKLQNTHGWNTDGAFVFHNGFIRSGEADRFEVDSQAIVHWLGKHTRRKAIGKLLAENYANVMVVDTEENDYLIIRAKSGRLFTDGKGNYSTNELGPVKIPVKTKTCSDFKLGLKREQPKTYRSDWLVGYGSGHTSGSVVSTPKTESAISAHNRKVSTANTAVKTAELFPDLEQFNTDTRDYVTEYMLKKAKGW